MKTCCLRFAACIIVVFLFIPQLKAQNLTDRQLQHSFIWTAGTEYKAGTDAHAIFRKTFTIRDKNLKQADLNIFAYTRFMLYINGQYVMRGPIRFENKSPGYATVNLLPYLIKGKNSIAVVVHCDKHSGRIMNHEPGFTALLNMNSKTGIHQQIKTDTTWKAIEDASYLARRDAWSSIPENVDARKTPEGSLLKDFNDSSWKNAVNIDTKNWYPLHKQQQPALREKEIKGLLVNGKPAANNLSLSLHAGDTVKVKSPLFTQAYLSIDMDAEEGSQLQLESKAVGLNNTYIARKGKQTYTTTDTYGLMDFSVKVKSGNLKITGVKLVERLYPFDCIGSFNSNDTLLNHMYRMLTRSLQVLSEDAYVDCADRERVEWMDNDPAAYDLTRVAFTGPDLNGKKTFGDPRLFAALLRRIALTQQADGRVKAHTSSDRFDIHAYMEDRACDWVEGIRKYYEATGDKALVNEVWKPVVLQMKWFLNHRTARGLVNAREWVVWGNPMGYQTCEGTALNAFVYKALIDAAYLGKAIGQNKDAEELGSAAKQLQTNVNKYLWNAYMGTYYAGYFDNDSLRTKSFKSRKVQLSTNSIGQVEPTFEAALFALDQDIVPAARLDSVKRFMMSKKDNDYRIMTYYYLFKQLYNRQDTASDTEVLNTIRKKWLLMANNESQMSWEDLNSNRGSKAHIYGIFPAWFLSCNVLGVKLDGPVWNKKLILRPQLGDLNYANGTVATELGPVNVSWKKQTHGLGFSITIPKGASATLQFANTTAASKILLSGKAIKVMHNGDKLSALLAAGTYQGVLIR